VLFSRALLFSSGLHAISAIAMMADSMRLQLNDRIKKIADQVTEGLNLEKKSWSSLYDVECEVTKMMSEIDERVEKAVSWFILYPQWR
jgi:hypothetical protein